MSKAVYRFVAVVNKKIPHGRISNALGHMSAGLMSQLLGEEEDVVLHDYHDASGGVHPTIPHDPFIVLQAKNSNQIKTLRQKLIDAGIRYTDFLKSMTIGTSAEQLEATASMNSDKLEYMGICFYGKQENLQPLTKKFSIYNPKDCASEFKVAVKELAALHEADEAKARELEVLYKAMEAKARELELLHEAVETKDQELAALRELLEGTSIAVTPDDVEHGTVSLDVLGAGATTEAASMVDTEGHG